MRAFRWTGLALSALVGAALSVAWQPATGHAYTQEQEQACTGDAMRLCGQFVPNVDAITACMVQKKSQLSPQCRVHFRPEPSAGRQASPRPVAAAKPKPVKKATATKKKKASDG